ncbi:MAG: polyhydroxyalkanoic acid synthase [Afipia sp. 62-7]|nr:polyhydroxyalkanoic acid system family protein [Afipia sp.]OJU15711.1 MAG: polyhydroxyalkanoic acid synthase [Afipia sp. 62-7]
MAQPFIVSIPHKLGKDEAVRRLKAGLGNIRSEYGNIFQVNEEIWSGDRLAFQVTALKQRVSGSIDVAEDHVRLEVLLPWLLAGLAHGIQATIRARAGRMLEKKTTDV